VAAFDERVRALGIVGTWTQLISHQTSKVMRVSHKGIHQIRVFLDVGDRSFGKVVDAALPIGCINENRRGGLLATTS